jgi:hypothetical protein
MQDLEMIIFPLREKRRLLPFQNETVRIKVERMDAGCWILDAGFSMLDAGCVGVGKC